MRVLKGKKHTASLENFNDANRGLLFYFLDAKTGGLGKNIPFHERLIGVDSVEKVDLG